MTLDEAIITMDVHISGRSQRIERAWNVIHAALVEGQKPTTNIQNMQLPTECPDPNCGAPIKVVAHHSAQCRYNR